jgi:hypothetical protein
MIHLRVSMLRVTQVPGQSKLLIDGTPHAMCKVLAACVSMQTMVW